MGAAAITKRGTAVCCARLELRAELRVGSVNDVVAFVPIYRLDGIVAVSV
jgi:hypothetical protein